MERVGEFRGTQRRRPGGCQQNHGRRAQDRLARAVPHRLRRAVFVAREHRGHPRPFRPDGRQLEIGIHAVCAGLGDCREKRAAPMATVVLGWVSIAGAWPNSADTSWETSGIWDEPPTSRSHQAAGRRWPATQWPPGDLERRPSSRPGPPAAWSHRAVAAGQPLSRRPGWCLPLEPAVAAAARPAARPRRHRS
jgi:hypothetical protein